MIVNYSKYLSHSIFKTVQEIATVKNVKAFVIGGFVRDLLIDRKSKDIDIVVLGNGPEMAQLVADELHVKKVNIFKTYGTAHFKYKDFDIEFVGARKESYTEHSRNPQIESGTLQDDQNRRDFTINSLAISLNQDGFGNLVDPFNGIHDLKGKLLRTPLDPAITFSDDPLRMLRAIRFATQLNFKIETKSLYAIKDNAHRLDIITKERIIEELNKMILSDQPSRGFMLLFSTNLLVRILPELFNLQGVETKNGKSHKDNFYHTLEVLDNVAKNTSNLWLRWAAIFHDIAKAPTKRFDERVGWTFHGHEDLGAKMIPSIFKRIGLPLNDKLKYVQKLVRLHLRPISLVKGDVTDSAIRRLLNEAGDDIDDLMLLCNADITSKNEFKVKKYKRNFQLVQEKLKMVEEKDKVRNFQPPINGQLIMETFLIKPCDKIGLIKQEIKEAILDGQIPNEFEAAYQLMLDLGKKHNLTQPKKS